MFLRANTRVLLSFHTWAENGFGGGRVGSFLPGLFRVQGLSTSKTFGPASGQFTIQVKPVTKGVLPSLLKLWKEPEGVWVYMWFQLNGQVFDCMLGNIDTISEEVERSGDGARSVSVTISGRDHGKVFDETELFINIHERRGVVPELPMYRALADQIQSTPAQLISALVREWVGNNEIADSQWQLPPSLYGGQSFYSALNRSTIDSATRGNTQAVTILQPDQQGQKLWDVLGQYSNPVLNEMWVDLAPDPGRLNQPRGGSTPTDPVTKRPIPLPATRHLRPALYLRERPFISSEFGHLKWDRLPTHELSEDQIVVASLAKGSSAERFNYWELVGASAQTMSINFIARVQEQTDTLVAGDGQVGSPGTIPIYNLTSIRRYGLRRFQQSSRYFPVNDVSIGELATGMIPRWLRLLHDWYAPAPREATGSLHTSYVMPWIRIGHRIRYKTRDGRGLMFYVEGVQHQYSYPHNGSTTITVTRGEDQNEHILHDIYEELRRVPLSVGDIEAAVPGMELTAEQARAFREDPQSALTAGLGSSSLNDPASGTDETGAPQGGESLLEATASAQNQGDSQLADPSMNFSDTAPRQSPAAAGVEGIDDNTNPPPEPTDSADPLGGVIVLDDVVISLDEEYEINSAGASIPEPE